MDNQQRMHKKSGNKSEAATAAQKHHPWDEVSLPGAGDSEQATILQVFSPVNTDDESQVNTATTVTTNTVPIKEVPLEEQQLSDTAHNNSNKKETTDVTDSAQQQQQQEQPSIVKELEEDASIERATTESDNLVSSYRKEPSNNQATISPNKLSDQISNTYRTAAAEACDVLRREEQTPDQQPSNVLDIESHLIETYDDYSAQEESVGINELPPIKYELTQGPSKIETDSNVRTVIEVEPAGSKTLKPVQTLLQRQGPQNLADKHNAPESTNPESTQPEEIQLQRVEDISEEIRVTAHKLLHEVEQKALETLCAEIERTKGPSETITAEEVTSAAGISKDISAAATEKTDASLLIVDTDAKLSQRVDEKIYEVTNLLKAANATVTANEVIGGDATHVAIVKPSQAKNNEEQIKILNGLPSPNTASEEEERKLFIDSLPQIPEVSDSNKLSADCKREYYQSLRKYLVNHNPDKPPIPLQTYRWEDLRRAKERGGYPWTHVYKRPLGPDEEPELVLLLRKSQELRFGSESPKSLKKVHYDEQVLVKETERYIQELAEEEEEEDEELEEEEEAKENAAESSRRPIEVEESHSVQSGSISCLSDSVLAVGKAHKSRRIDKIRGFLKRRRSGRSSEDAQSLPGTSVSNSRHHSEENVSPQPHSQLNGYQYEHQLKKPRCFPIMKKLKSMADRQKKRLHIKRISLKKGEKIILGDETKILNLKSSPKSDRTEIPHFIEKQDSDDVLEIVELDESPSRKHRDDGCDDRDKEPNTTTTNVVQPDEIIEIRKEFKVETENENDAQTPEPTVSDILEEEIKSSNTQAAPSVIDEQPPRKAPRLRREHVYEEIDQGDVAAEPINEILEMDSVEALKDSLIKQDNSVLKDVESVNKPMPLDRMGSSEEEQLTTAEPNAKLTTGLLAPISSIDSASSDEDRGRSQLPPVAEEESDVTTVDGHKKELLSERITNIAEENETTNTTELKPSIKKEASPAPSDKKVTFSQIENEAEPHREDIELPESVREAAGKRWKNMSCRTMNSKRSASVGALPREKKHFVSRTESSSGAPLDVRCACQYFESDSLLPDRINPVDSRPSSRLGFHSEIGEVHGTIPVHFVAQSDQQHVQPQFHPMNLDTSTRQTDNLSTRSFNVASPYMEVDRLSVRNIGEQRSRDQGPAAPVDLTFVEKYPELEETARSRGLVVRSISNATEGEPNVPGSGMFMAGHRRRQLSVGGMSVGGGMRDPDTISVRSVTSLRRISRSPSKADLFVADINIPTTHTDRRDQRSASGSRRTSNVDLSHFASHQNPPPTFVEPIQQTQTLDQAQITPPQVNLIAPTPSPADNSFRPDFCRGTTPQPTAPLAAPTQDYRIAKPPISTDYMRPIRDNSTIPQRMNTDILPQHRPIDVSKYADPYEQSTIVPEDITQDYRIAKPSISTDYMRPNEGNITRPIQTDILPQHRAIDVSKYADPYEQSTISPESGHLTQDYRIAKPPISTDYMRPIEGTITQPIQTNILPQNRSIDVSKYADPNEQPTISTESAHLAQDYRIAKHPISTDYMRPIEGTITQPIQTNILPQNRSIDVSKYADPNEQPTISTESAHLAQDYRIAKHPISTDYMRPIEGTITQPIQTNILPQNRSIDVSKYADPNEQPTISTESAHLAQDYRIAKHPISTDYMRPIEGTITQPIQTNILPQNRSIDVSKYADPNEQPTISTESAHLAQDYRIAKPPISTDYMRPIEGTITQPIQTNILPQNRSIDVSKYADPYEQLKTSQETAHSTDIVIKPTSSSEVALPSPLSAVDPLRQKVTALEEAALQNIVDIRDNIKLVSYRPASLAGDVPMECMHLDEQTKIDIKSSIPVVDIDELIRNEEDKAMEVNSKNKPMSRQQSPPPQRSAEAYQTEQPPAMDTLQLPDARSPFKDIQSNNTQAQLKRQHTPERNPSPDGHKRAMIQPQQPLESHTINSNDGITLEDASEEGKSSYASKFMSMFKSKGNDTEREPSPSRQKDPSPKREKSPSPAKGRNASPSGLMTMFTKNKPMPIEMMSGSNAIITKRPEAEPMSVKVTETFSLKVDEMDQYNSRPAKPPPGPIATPPHSIYNSREDFRSSGRVSADISEAFAPVVLVTGNRDKFLAGNRSLVPSDLDISMQRNDSEARFTSGASFTGQDNQPPKGALISVPIQIGESNEFRYSSSGGSSQRFLPRAPSEQRGMQPKVEGKSSFMEGRTQSQDRARFVDSHDDIYGLRMTKTVSFNFGERKSRLSEFENVNISQQTTDQKELLERSYLSRDHEYEPIGEPVIEEKAPVGKEPSPSPSPSPYPSPARPQTSALHEEIEEKHAEIQQTPVDIENTTDEMKEAEELQKDMEERYFSSETITPPTESRTDYEINTSKGDSSALEELPLKPENRRKSFMASAQDQTRKMQAGIKTQASKIKTKLRSPAKKPPSDSPKPKERRRFKTPEFSKIKMPELKRPDMSKLKDFKRPEFTKFNKPDMSKFKLPEKFTTLKLRRSKSFKENEEVQNEDMAGVAPEPKVTTEATTQKKMFEFNFGTYPRAFRKKKKQPEPELSLDTGTGPSVIPSTETQPSLESSSSPQGDRGPGPVRSRWADKFSDVSYNDSEGSRYRRYGSEQESFDRESSLERRMREDLEEAPSEDTDLGILGAVTDNRQFAEFDEENRAIHEISNLRAGEFKRRPIVHQDSDLISEESKDAIGWTEKEIQKNKLLRKAELEAESSYLNYPSEDRNTQETQSTASSGKKVVMEEIDDDEFFLRKRGVSQDNIELRQYISTAIREGFDMPVNALEQVGQTSGPPEYGDYDVPPPKPRRLHKNYRAQDVSQEFETPRSEYGDDLSMSQTGSDYFGAPKRPMRKRRSRSKYSIDSQDVSLPDTHHHQQYFDDDEEYLRPPHIISKEEDMDIMNLSLMKQEGERDRTVDAKVRPEAPRRRKRQQRETSMDTDSYINGFGGRSVSNSFLQPPNDVIVYRTEHEYHIPLATPENYTDGTSAANRKTRSISKFEDDDRTSREAESLGMEQTDDMQQFMTDMIENDGYAIVRKEYLPKPTPPARRKKFSRSPGERFATMPNMRTKRSSELPPERPPPPSGYSPLESLPARRKSALSLDESQNIEDDYEELQNLDHDRPESPRNLQSGDIINRMKYRPLPPPPRPPRDRRHRSVTGTESRQVDVNDEEESNFDDRDGGDERIATSSAADSYDHDRDFEWHDPRFVEVEVSTQTDPLPDDFVCEEFEITPDMKVIEPRKFAITLEDILAEEHPGSERPETLTEEEQLARGLQRFREANRRSLSEKSRTSSQADRSKSQSRPQTPSAVVIERRVSTPIPSRETTESMLEAALIVRPIDDLDLDIEEEALRREGLLTDSSQHSKSDVESCSQDEEQKLASDYSQEPSSADLEEALEGLRSQIESERETEDDKEVEHTMQLRDTSNYAGAVEVKRKEMLLEIKEHPVRIEITPPPTYESDIQSDFKEDDVKEDSTGHSYETKLSFYRVSETEVGQKENEDIATDDTAEEPPQPPPRRRSSITIEPPSLSIVEQHMTQKIAPQRSVVVEPALTAHMAIADLEVDRLRVHALQAGKIMVSHLQGAQISSDDLECKSGNLVVKNIELPSGFIEDIVERVRNSERSQLHAAETQTSLQGSDEVLSKEQILSSMPESVPPPKPPRQRAMEPLLHAISTPSSESAQPRNLEVDTTNESTQTLETMTSPPLPTTTNFPPVEYLQSLAPLAFYNLRNLETNADISYRRRRHKRARESSASEEDEVFGHDVDKDEHVDGRRRHRTRSPTRPVETQTVAQAGRQFLSVCNLSLVNIINQLTNSIRRETNKDQDTATRARQVPTLVALFIFITFGILLFLLSGKSIHHHHWDFFNPPGNNGRSS